MCERKGCQRHDVQRNDKPRCGSQATALPHSPRRRTILALNVFRSFGFAVGFATIAAFLGAIVTTAQTAGPPRTSAVPDTIQRELEKVGCHRPASQKDSITHGHFVRASQDDWAALCVSGRSSFIYVVWGGTAQCPSILATRHTTERALTTSPPDVVIHALQSVQPNRKGLIDHDGIREASAGSGPTIQYCLNRSWVSIPTTD